MRSTLVYDLPTRFFHFIFAILFSLSFVIGKAVDDESLLFSYHMLSGLLLGGLVIWRIIWGVVGSKHSRFSGFNLNLLELKDYFLGILSGSKQRWSGHNPASSWAAITMFLLTIGLVISGYLMSTSNIEFLGDIHELMANTFVLVVALHVAGVVLHSIRHQDAIGFSMVDGKKEIAESGVGITSSRPIAAALLLVLVIFSGRYLFKNFDSQYRTLTLFGQTLQLGESENENNGNDDQD